MEWAGTDDAQTEPRIVRVCLRERVEKPDIALFRNQPANREAMYRGSARQVGWEANGDLDVVGHHTHELRRQQARHQTAVSGTSGHYHPGEPGEAGVPVIESRGQVGAVPADPHRDRKSAEEVEPAVGQIEILDEDDTNAVAIEKSRTASCLSTDGGGSSGSGGNSRVGPCANHDRFPSTVSPPSGGSATTAVRPGRSLLQSHSTKVSLSTPTSGVSTANG